MANFQLSTRKAVRWLHLWVGLILGLVLAVMGVTGGIVALRPQAAMWLSPSVPAGACVMNIDWTLASQAAAATTGTAPNRIYFPEDGDTRVRFRMDSDTDKVFKHVIFDTCSGKVIGMANLGWMDWLVDFHHNLRAEKEGRTWAGRIALVMLLSGFTGFILWALSGAKLSKLFAYRAGQSGIKTSLDLHRVFGLAGGLFLVVGAFTSLWLCFPQTMRAILATVAPISTETRPPRGARTDGAKASLGDWIQAAQTAIPDGRIREIRLPEGNANVQIRMYRAGDFRSLGNNVVSVAQTGKVVGVDLYEKKPFGNRFVQAMAGLHYGEWGGLVYRSIYAAAGFASGLLLVTGVLIWWLPKRKQAVLRKAA